MPCKLNYKPSKRMTIDNWVMTDLHEHKNPDGCRWVYKVKRIPDGSIEQHKARLVPKGDTPKMRD